MVRKIKIGYKDDEPIEVVIVPKYYFVFQHLKDN